MKKKKRTLRGKVLVWKTYKAADVIHSCFGIKITFKSMEQEKNIRNGFRHNWLIDFDKGVKVIQWGKVLAFQTNVAGAIEPVHI